jgi:O-antigen ligase
VVLGGSAQAIWGNFLLQIAGLLMIGWFAITGSGPLKRPERHLLLFLAAGLALIILQLIPLPPAIWTNLPGRSTLIEGYSLLREPLPNLPLSMAPFDTLSCGLALVPPIAVVLAATGNNNLKDTWALAAIVGATLLSAILGYAQVISGSSTAYLYDMTNVGSAVGFFANRNHIGTLLLISIPCIAVLVISARSGELKKSLPAVLFGGSSAIVVLLAIAMNGSLATILIAIPVLLASASLAWKSRRLAVAALTVAALVALAVTPFLANSPVQGKLTGAEKASIIGRQEIWASAVMAGTSVFPVGSGCGSFSAVYTLEEQPQFVSSTYVNHAHNDFIEMFVEGGLLALVLVAGFIAWWGFHTWRAWTSGPIVARAGSIATAAMLIHSLVDYPLRTTALSVIFCYCLVLVLQRSDERSAPSRASSGDLRAMRHAVIR